MTVVDGGPVLPHVQAFADEVNRQFGITHIMTYAGHQPTQDRALDNFGTREQMLALAQWTTRDDVIDFYGIDYTMFDVNQTTVGSEIYNREIARYWRQVEDRGSPTQNHHDHVHVSFNPTGVAKPGQLPTPSPEEDDDMPIAFVEIIPPGEQRTIGVPPCKSGGAGWGQVWGSLSVDNYGGPPNDCRVMLKNENGSDWRPASPQGDIVHLQSGRSFGWGFAKGDQCVSIENRGKRSVSFLCEAVKA